MLVAGAVLVIGLVGVAVAAATSAPEVVDPAAGDPGLLCEHLDDGQSVYEPIRRAVEHGGASVDLTDPRYAWALELGEARWAERIAAGPARDDPTTEVDDAIRDDLALLVEAQRLAETTGAAHQREREVRRAAARVDAWVTASCGYPGDLDRS